jgi:hypothetical protein
MIFFLHVNILEALMMVLLMMNTFLLEKSLMELIFLRVIMLFLQVNIFMEDPMTLVGMVIIFQVSLRFLLSMRVSMKMTLDLGMKIIFSIIQLQQIKVIDILLFDLLTMFCLIFLLVMRKILLVRMMK